jgi:alcohol dehydrogenase class IV
VVTGLAAGETPVPSTLECALFSVRGEPTTDLAREGVGTLRREGCDLVVGIGGGSAIDAGKAIAALAANSGEPLDYLEVVGRGRALEHPSLPCIAVPTTAGTGAEVTRNAVLASPEHRVKASLRHVSMLPRVAIVDPELTYGLPPALTASTGLDALTQLIEPFVSVRANPMTDAVCLEGMRRAARSLARAFADGRNAVAREDMSLASLFGGIALANAGLGAVHGFAAPVGGAFDAPHGAVCAALLPHVMEANILALRTRASASPALGRYRHVARVLTGRPDAEPEDAVKWVASLVQELRVPGLAAYGVRTEDVAELAAKAAQASSMKGNPIALTPEELAGILDRALY